MKLSSAKYNKILLCLKNCDHLIIKNISKFDEDSILICMNFHSFMCVNSWNFMIGQNYEHFLKYLGEFVDRAKMIDESDTQGNLQGIFHTIYEMLTKEME